MVEHIAPPVEEFQGPSDEPGEGTAGNARDADPWAAAAVEGQEAKPPVPKAPEPPVLEVPSAWQKAHDERFREVLEEIDRYDQASFNKIVAKHGGKLPDIKAPAPSDEERKAAAAAIDERVKEDRRLDVSLEGKAGPDKLYEDSAAMQKAILSGDSKAIQLLMEKYKDKPDELARLIHDVAGMVREGVIIHYNKEADGSVTMTINNEPGRYRDIEPIVAFSSKPGTAPYIAGHAIQSSISRAAQWSKSGALPGDLSAAETLTQIGNLATANLARRKQR